MKERRSAFVTACLLGAALTCAAAHAQDAQSECIARRIKIAAKYQSCRANAQARAVRGNGDPDFTSCDVFLDRIWELVATQGGDACPDRGSPDLIRAEVSGDVDDIVRLLTPLPPACGPFPACNGACSTGLTCTLRAGTCSCLPSVTTPCADTGGGVGSALCGGACPDGEACTVINTDVTTLITSCACLPPDAAACVTASAPTCGGVCPSGLTCSPSAGWPCACQ
jgi:hypothetical protein